MPPPNRHHTDIDVDEVFHARDFAAVAAAVPLPAVFVDKSTRVICQGIMGKNSTFHTEQAIEYGTDMVRHRHSILKMQSLHCPGDGLWRSQWGTAPPPHTSAQ
jgi:hypothetical protein